jgi:hypothetical protein
VIAFFSNFAPVSHKQNVKEHVLSKNGCTWGGFNSLSAMDGCDHPLLNSFVVLWFLAEFLSVHRV